MEDLISDNFNDNGLLGRKIDLLLRTGQLLVEASADTNRIMRDMLRTASYLGIPEKWLHIHITFTMLMVNVSDNGEHSITKFQKCQKHGINMTTLSLVSKLSWRAIEEDYSLDQYEEELDAIARRKRNYTPLVVAIGAGFACGGFCKLFGCDWVAFFITSFCAFLGFRVRFYCNKFGINTYMSIAIAAFVSTCAAYLFHYVPWTETPMHPLLACALFIVPGVPMINFVDDMLDNYILVGLTRALNTFLMVGAMTFGIVFAIQLFQVDDFIELSMRPHSSYFVYAVAAAISAMGFSMIFNIPVRLLPVVAVGGIIAVCTRNFVNFGLGQGLIIGSFAGSVLVSLIAVKAVHWFHVPNHVLTIPSVIPMVPGVYMYRLLFGLVNFNALDPDSMLVTIQSGLTSGITVLGMAVGVAIPNIFLRRYLAKGKRLHLEQILAERKARGKFLDW